MMQTNNINHPLIITRNILNHNHLLNVRKINNGHVLIIWIKRIYFRKRRWLIMSLGIIIIRLTIYIIKRK